MIITRTPFRISFFGGGTDYPVWYEKNGGAVLSTTINKYCYISCRYLPPFFPYKFRIRYSFREETQTVNEIKHPSVRECLKFIDIKEGIEMVHTSDLPAQSGMGSSSSFTVGFLNALYALIGKIVGKKQLAIEAIHIEQNLMKENIGSQDQVAVAFGGFNKITFGGEEQVYVQPVTINSEKINLLQEYSMLFFTGFVRNASEIAGEQIRLINTKRKYLTAMMEMVEKAVEILNSRTIEIEKFARLLHESWMIKKELSSLISTPQIDEIYDTARSAGASGGKLLGAGGGGFMLIFADPRIQPKIREKLKKVLCVPFRFENLGSQVIFYSPQESLSEINK
jgi:D-glycero-alpha-D-manno-heptose-7-phosphate kinase